MRALLFILLFPGLIAAGLLLGDYRGFAMFAIGSYGVGFMSVALLPHRFGEFIRCAIASAIVLKGIMFLAAVLKTNPPFLSGRKGIPDALSALLVFVIFVLPGVAYLWYTRFGFGKTLFSLLTPNDTTAVPPKREDV